MLGNHLGMKLSRTNLQVLHCTIEQLIGLVPEILSLNHATCEIISEKLKHNFLCFGLTEVDGAWYTSSQRNRRRFWRTLNNCSLFTISHQSFFQVGNRSINWSPFVGSGSVTEIALRVRNFPGIIYQNVHVVLLNLWEWGCKLRQDWHSRLLPAYVLAIASNSLLHWSFVKGELINMTQAWDKEKKSESLAGIKPLTS